LLPWDSDIVIFFFPLNAVHGSETEHQEHQSQPSFVHAPTAFVVAFPRTPLFFLIPFRMLYCAGYGSPDLRLRTQDRLFSPRELPTLLFSARSSSQVFFLPLSVSFHATYDFPFDLTRITDNSGSTRFFLISLLGLAVLFLRRLNYFLSGSAISFFLLVFKCSFLFGPLGEVPFRPRLDLCQPTLFLSHLLPPPL